MIEPQGLGGAFLPKALDRPDRAWPSTNAITQTNSKHRFVPHIINSTPSSSRAQRADSGPNGLNRRDQTVDNNNSSLPITRPDSTRQTTTAKEIQEGPASDLTHHLPPGSRPLEQPGRAGGSLSRAPRLRQWHAQHRYESRLRLHSTCAAARPRLGSSLPSLVSQKPDPRVPWPDALRVLGFIAASLHSHAAQPPNRCRAATPICQSLGKGGFWASS